MEAKASWEFKEKFIYYFLFYIVDVNKLHIDLGMFKLWCYSTKKVNVQDELWV